jgi:hypothetical protein
MIPSEIHVWKRWDSSWSELVKAAFTLIDGHSLKPREMPTGRIAFTVMNNTLLFPPIVKE